VDLKAFKRTLLYQRTAAPAAVRSDLATIRSLDDLAERRQLQGALGCTAALVAAIAAFGVVAATEGATWSWVLLGLTFVAAVVGELWVLAGRRVDVPNQRYELLDQVLALLALDLAEDPVEVRLDLGAKVDGPWLVLRGRLRDATALGLEAADGPAAGDAVPAAFTVELRPEPNRYHDLAALGRAADAVVRLPEGAALDELSIEDDRLRLRAVTEGAWRATPPGEAAWTVGPEPEGDEVVALALLSLYHVLNLSGALTAARAG